MSWGWSDEQEWRAEQEEARALRRAERNWWKTGIWETSESDADDDHAEVADTSRCLVRPREEP